MEASGVQASSFLGSARPTMEVFPVQARLVDLASTLGSLEDRFGALVSRLGPVLTPVEPSVTDHAKPREDVQRSAMASELAQLHTRVAELDRQLSLLLDRLEIGDLDGR